MKWVAYKTGVPVFFLRSLSSINIIKYNEIALGGFNYTTMHFSQLIRIILSRLSYAAPLGICDSNWNTSQVAVL